MTGYHLNAIDAYGRTFDTNYRRVRRWLTRRRFRETPEGVVIERLHKMLLAQNYTVTVNVFGRKDVYRLTDHAPKKPTDIMLRKPAQYPVRRIEVIYGPYRDFDLFNRALCEFEGDVAHKIMLEVPGFDHGAEVVMAGVVMLGEIWASRGTVVP